MILIVGVAHYQLGWLPDEWRGELWPDAQPSWPIHYRIPHSTDTVEYLVADVQIGESRLTVPARLTSVSRPDTAYQPDTATFWVRSRLHVPTVWWRSGAIHERVLSDPLLTEVVLLNYWQRHNWERDRERQLAIDRVERACGGVPALRAASGGWRFPRPAKKARLRDKARWYIRSSDATGMFDLTVRNPKNRDVGCSAWVIVETFVRNRMFCESAHEVRLDVTAGGSALVSISIGYAEPASGTTYYRARFARRQPAVLRRGACR